MSIPGTVTSICNGAFKQCSNLKTLVIPEDLEIAVEGGTSWAPIIGAFADCCVFGSKDTHVCFPLKLESIAGVRTISFPECGSFTFSTGYTG